MKHLIISGSQRSEANSLKVSHCIKQILEEKSSDNQVELISLESSELPLWNESIWQSDSALAKLWQPFKTQLQEAESFIVVCPEWSGMVPSALKNFLLFCTASELGHKPALIVSVSSGIGGSYPVNELRTSGYKNNRICYIPEHLIIRHVDKFLEELPSPSSEHQKNMLKRTHYALEILRAYAEALKPIRNSGLIDHKSFPNGM